MSESKFPAGWDAERVKRLIDYYEGLTEDEQVAEDEAASRARGSLHDPELAQELKAELDRRLDALDKNPDAVVSWEVVEARALERFRK